MADPFVFGGAALLLMMMLGGKKKKKKPGPCVGLECVPVDPENSDPLPDGSKGGHLPKGGDYGSQIPDDMGTDEIWISSDCLAFVIGEDWMPNVMGQTPTQWFLANDDGYSTRGAVFTNAAWYANPMRFVVPWLGLSGDPEHMPQPAWPGEGGGVYPRGQRGIFPYLSALDLFTQDVIIYANAGCGFTIPEPSDYTNVYEWYDAFNQWRDGYPVLDWVAHFISLSSHSEMEQAIMDNTPQDVES